MEDKKDVNSICKEFAHILHGKSKSQNGSCSVSLHRTFNVQMLGKNASSSLEVAIIFQDLDDKGYALNFSEVAVLQQEVPAFVSALMQQGIIVSAVHNHWLFTDPPQMMYVHCQSVEPPLLFARKMAYAFTQLESLPQA